MSSLKKQLEELTNPAPGLADLEDEDFDGTSSRKLLTKDVENEDTVETGVRRIRQELDLDQLDEKYRGSKTTRSEIFGDNSGFSLTNGFSEKTVETSDDEEEVGFSAKAVETSDDEVDLIDEDYHNPDNLAIDYGEDDEENIESGSEDEIDDNDERDVAENETIKENGFKTMGESNNGEDSKKSEAVRAQFQLWEHIMRLTIKAHAALRAFNQFPRGDDAKNMFEESNDEVKQSVKQLRSNIFSTLDALVDISTILNKKGAEKLTDEDDEEIESSTDEEGNKSDTDDQSAENGLLKDRGNSFKNVTPGKAVNQTLSSFQKKLIENEKQFADVAVEVLTKWDDRTKLVGRSSKNTKNLVALESSVTKQIDRIMSDKLRLLHRTQQRRSENYRLGADQESTTDPEIFDDDDFYQTLLKEFIEEKSGQTSDPHEMTRRFIELQKLRETKVKKVKDRSGNKERRIKFVTVPKLVNFYASRPENVEWSHERRNELFKSLFK
uniref:Protein AATF n=1 Tax=Panagrolaimus sp. JU765 TaxID=591449 RepID=A0AC34R995_9BILA